MDLPYLTADQPGIGGEIKQTPSDFFVEELPLYSPSGEGQHVYVQIEKTGLSTYAAIRKIAKALNVSSRTIGHAGLKDAQAVTRQTLSIDLVQPEAVQALELPGLKILNVARHKNKLKIGHLAGNRFVIRVRGVTPAAESQARATLAILSQKGAPNFFGQQRFGNRGNTDRLGEMLIRQNAAEFVAEYLGRPQPDEPPSVQTARQRVDEGDWSGALELWPGYLSDERRALRAIQQAGGDLQAAFRSLNKKLKSLFVSAFQSRLFNQLLTHRLPHLDRLETGDVAYIHHKGAAFIVTDAATEQPRVASFEISPSGPLFGSKTLLAEQEPGRRERAILAHHNLSPEDFTVPGLKIRGARRPYRLKLEAVETWWDEGLMVSFQLQPGAYATTVMAELMKN